MAALARHERITVPQITHPARLIVIAVISSQKIESLTAQRTKCVRLRIATSASQDLTKQHYRDFPFITPRAAIVPKRTAQSQAKTCFSP